MSRAAETARRIYVEALEMQWRLDTTPALPGAGRRHHPVLHAGLMALLIAVLSVALLLVLARPALP